MVDGLPKTLVLQGLGASTWDIVCWGGRRHDQGQRAPVTSPAPPQRVGALVRQMAAALARFASRPGMPQHRGNSPQVEHNNTSWVPALAAALRESWAPGRPPAVYTDRDRDRWGQDTNTTGHQRPTTSRNGFRSAHETNTLFASGRDRARENGGCCPPTRSRPGQAWAARDPPGQATGPSRRGVAYDTSFLPSVTGEALPRGAIPRTVHDPWRHNHPWVCVVPLSYDRRYSQCSGDNLRLS